MSEWREYKFSELLVDESISYGIVQPGTHTEVWNCNNKEDIELSRNLLFV